MTDQQPEAIGYAACLEARGFEAEAAELRRLHEVEKQRDELLAALRGMLEQFTQTRSTLADSEARVRAHAAIAKVEGAK